MNFSTEIIEIENKCDELIQLIINSDIFNEYKIAKENLKNDKEAINSIKHFMKIKEKYDEVQRFGKYHPDFTVTRKEMSEIKTIIDLNQSISNFKKIEKNLQLLLDDIGLIIAESVSDSIIVSTESGSLGKGCSCSSGKKGCSCK
ncbi:MAG: regulator [Bacillales bacterium]|jgi:cell fate (sporulation/competence/biofilm development) regulator YlbF (YheA/YmcA/DUF963 family)|nr:regulator [Bacillales bacterium]